VGLKDYHKGFRDLNKAIELDPEWEECYTQRNLYYFFYINSFGDPDSQAVYESYPSVDATNLYFQKKYDEAIDRINKAIEIDPQEAYAYSLRGSIYFSAKKYQQAFQDSRKAIELNPNASDALFLSGQIHYHLGNYYQAIKDYRKCIDIGKSMIIFYLLGQPIETQNSINFFYLGRCYHKLKDYKEAIKAYSTSIELYPTYADAYVMRAFACDNLGNKQQYLNDLKTAARLGDEYSQSTLSAAGIRW
jgi:tetratricopeptide (TPR) repeat protein